MAESNPRWALHLYLCADNQFGADLERDLAEIRAAGERSGVAIAVQIDRADRCERLAFGAATASREPMVAIDSGDPAALEAFLAWADTVAPADRVAVVLSGPGISEDYVRSSDVGSRRLFAICHDRTSRDALEISELGGALASAVARRRRAYDLVGFDVGSTALVEIAFELEGLADVMVAPLTLLPDDGWPYREVISLLDGSAGDGPALARIVLAELANKYPRADLIATALRLSAVPDVARALDALAVSLLHGFGTRGVVQAVGRATGGLWTVPGGAPAVDLMGLLHNLEIELGAEATTRGADVAKAGDAREVIVESDALRRISQLVELCARARNALTALVLETTPMSRDAGLRGGIGLGFPLTPLDDRLADTNYLGLRFAQQVHWTAVAGVYQTIGHRPWRLWRVISSLLGEPGGGARDALLARLVSRTNIVGALGPQLRSISSGLALALTVDIVSHGDASEAIVARFRLDSGGQGAAVLQDESRFYRASFERAIARVESLIASGEPSPHAMDALASLGASLGEDVLQGFADRLGAARHDIEAETLGEAPHLILSIPPALMHYPWELIADRDGALGLGYAVGRKVFLPGGVMRPSPARSDQVVRVLVIGDPLLVGGDLPQLAGAAAEAAAVAGLFERLNDELGGLPAIEVTSRIHDQVTGDQVRQWLRSGAYDIVHFAGHGEFDARRPDRSAWVLTDGPLQADQLASTLRASVRPPWLVFANACEAGMDRASRRYQGHVSGLATALVGGGVAAYVGPLWPVDDAVATALACEFYRELLANRRSLGSALHLARHRLIEALEGGQLGMSTTDLPASVALTWAGFVLYGDPRPRLMSAFQASDGAPAKTSPPTLAPRHGPAQPRARSTLVLPRPRLDQLHAEVARRVVEVPGMISAERFVRGDRAPKEPVLELVEVNGVRAWRRLKSSGTRGARGVVIAEPLHANGLYALATGPRREALGAARGFGDYFKVLGRWLLDRVTFAGGAPLATRLAAQYDVNMTPRERLVRVRAGGELETLASVGDGSSWSPGAISRVLLLVHGTFVNSGSPVSGFGEDFLAEARQRYDHVLAFDHWTLSKTPEQNARDLVAMLPDALLSANKVDIVSHSRGGLVSRSLVELIPESAAMCRKVVFLATPNKGTNLANPDHTARVADLFVNLLHLGDTLGPAAGFLAQLAAHGTILGGLTRLIDAIPGLQSMNSKPDQSPFLAKLNVDRALAAGVSYAAVAANYEPDTSERNIVTFLHEAKDAAIDAFYGDPNDIVVDTSHVWQLEGAGSPTAIGKHLQAEDVLVFNPDPKMALPVDVPRFADTGVWHCNLFGNPKVQSFLREKLA